MGRVTALIERATIRGAYRPLQGREGTHTPDTPYEEDTMTRQGLLRAGITLGFVVGLATPAAFGF
jgi:hypothetical protein